MKHLEKKIIFEPSEWDSAYFDVNCAKVIIHEPLNQSSWHELKSRFKEYQFISIVNVNSEPVNAQMIGKDTPSFLADVNIQFEKRIINLNELENQERKRISIHQAMKREDQLISLADFRYSKFTEDPDLAKRGGENVYKEWLINSFEKKNKFFAISKNSEGKVNGFVLFSYLDNNCIIELIAVSINENNSGVGTALFKSVEFEAFKQGICMIKVGTQLRNTGAINFYHKVGCKQIGCNQVFHLWNV